MYPSPPDITSIAAGNFEGPLTGVTAAEAASEGVVAALIPKKKGFNKRIRVY